MAEYRLKGPSNLNLAAPVLIGGPAGTKLPLRRPIALTSTEQMFLLGLLRDEYETLLNARRAISRKARLKMMVDLRRKLWKV